MEKTAMNQMLEELIAHEWEIPINLIVKAKELIQVEKEQIIKAATLPREKRWYNTMKYKNCGEQHYYETYENKV